MKDTFEDPKVSLIHCNARDSIPIVVDDITKIMKMVLLQHALRWKFKLKNIAN